MNAALYSQKMDRALARRFVHAQRARTLRRAGKCVTFHHTSATGRTVYVYVPRTTAVSVDYAPSWGAEPYTFERAREDLIALREVSRRAVLGEVAA